MTDRIDAMMFGVAIPFGMWKTGLSLKARTLLIDIYALTGIPGWRFSTNGLVEMYGKYEAKGAGRDAIDAGLKELQDSGYLHRFRERSSDGKQGGARWAISLTPVSREQAEAALDGYGWTNARVHGGPDNPAPENPALVQPASGKPMQEKPEVDAEPVPGFQGTGFPQQEKDQEKEKSPPVSPKGGEANGKVKAPGRKRSGIELTPDLLPATLGPVTNSLCRWWNTAKTGKRSQEALVLLLSDLERIRVEGGIEAVAEQIERAIEAKVNGKGWQSISHRNWIRFAPPQQRQQAQERQRAMEPTGEQREILDLAARHPSLFQAAQQGPDGRVIVHFTREAIEAATQARGSAYPASTTASIVSALEAEIAFLRGAMAHAQVSQGLDNCVCPF